MKYPKLSQTYIVQFLLVVNSDDLAVCWNVSNYMDVLYWLACGFVRLHCNVES